MFKDFDEPLDKHPETPPDLLEESDLRHRLGKNRPSLDSVARLSGLKIQVWTPKPQIL